MMKEDLCSLYSALAIKRTSIDMDMDDDKEILSPE
jgi:hypothetical protein